MALKENSQFLSKIYRHFGAMDVDRYKITILVSIVLLTLVAVVVLLRSWTCLTNFSLHFNHWCRRSNDCWVSETCLEINLVIFDPYDLPELDISGASTYLKIENIAGQKRLKSLANSYFNLASSGAVPPDLKSRMIIILCRCVFSK